MDFEHTEEERNAAARSQTFVTEVLPCLPPHPLDFALAAHAALGERGFFNGPSAVGAVLSVAGLAAGSASLGAVAASGWLFADCMRRYGGAGRDPLAAAASAGTVIGCVAFGATGGGSRGNGARATRVQDGIRLEGTSVLVANCPIATHAVVVAGTEGAGVLAVHLDETELDPRRAPEPTGLGLRRLPRCSIALGGALLEAGAELTSSGSQQAAGEALVHAGRILTAALALGLAERATTRALSRVATRRPKLPQSTDFLLADLATDLEAATLSVTRAAWLRDAGAPHALESAAGKWLATRTATRAVHAALGIAGEQDTDLLRSAYLDARALEMQSGDEREQQDTMASVMLGER